MYMSVKNLSLAIGDIPYIVYAYSQGYTLNGIEKVMLFLRMPRMVLAVLVGVGLALSGAIIQSVTRNYLVSPFTLGISSSAAFGAAICIAFGSKFLQSDIGIIIGAFSMSCLCLCIVQGITSYIGVSPTSLVLIGISMNYIFSAMTAVVEFFTTEYKLGEIIQWSFGTLSRATWENVIISSIVIAICVLFIIRHTITLNALAQNNDEMVRSLGINPERFRIQISTISVLISATLISYTGVIGFVGLVGPHIARILVGNDHRFFLPVSAVSGAWLMILADAVGKYLVYPVSLPVGVIISFIGVPIFINLILTSRRRI